MKCANLRQQQQQQQITHDLHTRTEIRKFCKIGKLRNNFAENGPKLDFSKKMGIKMNQKPPMTFEEAAKILGFEQEVKSKDQVDFSKVQQTFEKLYSVNEPAKGGSPYIQSRVWNARQQIETELLNEGLLKQEEYQEFKKATDALLETLRNNAQQQQQQAQQ